MKLTPVQERLVAKLAAAGLVQPDAQVIRNPYNGKSHHMEPLAVGLFYWIVSPSRGDNQASGKETRGLWDKARYLFLALWPDQYLDLLD